MHHSEHAVVHGLGVGVEGLQQLAVLSHDLNGGKPENCHYISIDAAAIDDHHVAQLGHEPIGITQDQYPREERVCSNNFA